MDNTLVILKQRLRRNRRPRSVEEKRKLTLWLPEFPRISLRSPPKNMHTGLVETHATSAMWVKQLISYAFIRPIFSIISREIWICLVAKQVGNLIHIHFFPPCIYIYIYINYDASQALWGERSEINSQQFGICFASISGGNGWARHYHPVIFWSFWIGETTFNSYLKKL